jgi:Tfp pilus assembly protein FimT
VNVLDYMVGKAEDSPLALSRFVRGKKMTHKRGQNVMKENKGFSIAELMMVLTIGMILSAIALPQMIGQRRLTRSTGVTREISAQLRYARQLAMSRRLAFTFQYDDAGKQINIIGPIPVGTAALANPAYPNNIGSSVVSTVGLTQGGLPSSEISYGIPTATDLPAGAPSIPTGALDDGISKTSPSSNKVNVTFQPDGSVINAAGSPDGKAIFIFNNKAAQGTASAISVIGASGRVKVWRYTTNGNKYAE